MEATAVGGWRRRKCTEQLNMFRSNAQLRLKRRSTLDQIMARDEARLVKVKQTQRRKRRASQTLEDDGSDVSL